MHSFLEPLQDSRKLIKGKAMLQIFTSTVTVQLELVTMKPSDSIIDSMLDHQVTGLLVYLP